MNRPLTVFALLLGLAASGDPMRVYSVAPKCVGGTGQSVVQMADGKVLIFAGDDPSLLYPRRGPGDGRGHADRGLFLAGWGCGEGEGSLGLLCALVLAVAIRRRRDQ